MLEADLGSSVYRIGMGLLLLSGRKSKSSLILRKGNERNCHGIITVWSWILLEHLQIVQRVEYKQQQIILSTLGEQGKDTNRQKLDFQKVSGRGHREPEIY